MKPEHIDSLVEVERKLQALKNHKPITPMVKSGIFLVAGLFVVVGLYAIYINEITLGIVVIVIGCFFPSRKLFLEPSFRRKRIAQLEQRAEALLKSVDIQSSIEITPDDTSNAVSIGEKSCPYCSEQIKSSAIVCRYCGRDLPRDSMTVPISREQARVMAANPTNPENGLGTAALVLGILGLFTIPFILSILAALLGTMGDARVRAGRATNKGVAVTGALLGVLGMLVWLVILFWYLVP